jgi:ABC-2 type transport system permease protein
VSALALAWDQFRLERKLFWRNPSAAFFNFMLPLLLLLLIASVFSSNGKELNVLIPGIAGMSVMATTFTALAFNLTFLREQGILKRVRGTPLPAVSYFGGLLGSAVLNAFVQMGLVVLLGHVLYGVDWPQNWLLLVGFTALGVVCFGALGIAFSYAIPNFDAAPAYTNAVFLPLIFISGVFYSSTSMPRALEVIAEVLPLKHVIDGLHGAIVTGSGLGSTWDSLLVLVAWGAFGLWVVLRRFRWEP